MATKSPKKTAAAPAPAPETNVMALPKQDFAVAAPGDWRAKLKAFSEKNKAALAKAPTEGGQQLGFRQGVTTYMGQTIKGPLPLVILALQNERSYHSTQFDSNNPVPPDCYSYDTETPHAEATEPQSDDCASCPMNAWGSGERRGKACKEGLRFAAIHADDLVSLERIRSAPIATARISTMNSKTANTFFTAVEQARGHVAMVVTELTNEPDANWQYKLSFKALSPVELDDELGQALADKIEQAEKILATPYPALEEKPVAMPKSRKPVGKLPPPKAKPTPAKGGVKRTRMQ